jgi:hypothetical protein
MPIVTSLTSNGVFQTIGGLGGFDEISLDSGSINFNGTTDYLGVQTNASLALGTNSFTAEAWVYKTSYTTNSPTGYEVIYSSAFSNGFNITVDTIGRVSSSSSQILNIITTTNSIPLNAWTHIAVVRNGTNYNIYFNGLRVATTVTNSTNFSGASTVQVGAEMGATNTLFRGYISNLRVVNGTALYTANFIPSTAIVEPVTNTKLLLAVNPQNSFGDSSSNNLTITRNGTPRFNSIGPFYYPGNTSINLANTNNNPVLGSNTNIITSTTSNGVVMVTNEFDEVSMTSQSLRFDGSYLTPVSSTIVNFGTSDFTIELWIYPLTDATFNFFDGRSSSGQNAVTIVSTATTLTFFDTNGTARITGTTPLTVLAWNHVAVTRAGTDVKLFLNGIQQSTTYTSSLNYISGTNRPAIGAGGFAAGSSSLNGYLSNVRVVKNTALYTTNFTPPQMALSPIANTVLLLNNFAAEPFVDNSSNNNTIIVNGVVTANTLTPFANTQRKILNTGIMMVKEFDEYSMNAFAATGGNVTTSGAYTIHTFTANGTFEVTSGSKSVEYLVVAGGGGGGTRGGGGGAGGFITSSVLVTTQSYTVTVGVGGAGGLVSGTASGSDGANSSVFGVTAIGGGGGGGGNQASNTTFINGRTGGSGGGGAAWYGNGLAGANTAGQGSNGGAGVDVSPYMHGGGGGASEAGQNGGTVASTGGKGGDGLPSSISGSVVNYAGGGGGGTNGGGIGGAGGLGGGGAGATTLGTSGFNATANTGGGGGGGAGSSSGGAGGAGGSGIVIIRYLT